MKTSFDKITRTYAKIENKVNRKLKTLQKQADDARPELPSREKIVSIAYAANGYYEATGQRGGINHYTEAQVLAW